MIDLSESAASSDEAVNVKTDASSSYGHSQRFGCEDTCMDITTYEDIDGSNKVGEGHNHATCAHHDAAGNGTRDDPHVIKMIRQGQKLYSLLEQIHSPVERDLYVQELINVGALLAYPHPESSPLARYLSMERREAVAEQINKAILGMFDSIDLLNSACPGSCVIVLLLVRTGQSPISKIEAVIRYTTILWTLANELKVKVRPGAVVPPVISIQKTSTPPSQTKQVSESDQVCSSNVWWELLKMYQSDR